MLRNGLLFSLLFLFISTLHAQINDEKEEAIRRTGGTIATAVPFLLISPDARSGALADIGAATSPDINSQHWNAAKYAFIDAKSGVSLTYSPWLRALVSDMNLLYLSGYYRLDDRGTLAASLRFFSMGEVVFRSDDLDASSVYRPNEYAVDLSYSRMLTDNFSISIAGRYIRSDLTQGYVGPGGTAGRAANSASADISMFYTRDLALSGTLGSKLSFGLNLSNIGAKLSYSDMTNKEFLPANLRFGASYMILIDKYNSLTIMADINKLLVPTPPQVSGDTIIHGMDPNVGVMQGMLQSFYDAPDGFREELQEINWAIGMEYWYNKVLAFRGGYFNESKEKGSRRYFTLGAGLRFNVFELDFSYLMPASSNVNNPLKNTLRFTLGFNFSEYMRQRKTDAKPN